MDLDVNQKKEFIVLTAVDLINENGMNNLSTKEIAKRVGISESLIFKIYPKKYDLFLAVLDFFALYDKDLFLTAQEKNDNAIDAFLFYIEKFLGYYENYPAITSIYQILNTKTGTPQIDDRSKEINRSRLNYIKQFILESQVSDRIGRTIEADILAEIIYSTLIGLCIQWKSTDCSFPLLQRSKQALELILKSIETR